MQIRICCLACRRTEGPSASSSAARLSWRAFAAALSATDNTCRPGLVSAGAALPDAPGLPEGRVVAVYAQGKELACAVGVLKMSTEDIKSIRKGVAIDVASYLNDDLWLLCGPDGKGLA